MLPVAIAGEPALPGSFSSFLSSLLLNARSIYS